MSITPLPRIYIHPAVLVLIILIIILPRYIYLKISNFGINNPIIYSSLSGV